jgi:alanine-glyoxylate transaminase/serine-glyoxylate transaminase/serine-pyruvate transaminase
MDEIKAMLRLVFRTSNELTIPLSGPGSVGMETCLVNLLEPGDTAVVCVNGAFGARMVEICRRCGANTIVVAHSWGQTIDIDRVERALRENASACLLAFVHAETSTGARSDAQALCHLAAKHGALSVMDAVTSLGGIPVDVDFWAADAVYSGTQKCLSCPPGISPITLNKRAIERIQKRTTKVQSWFMDLGLVMSYWGDQAGRTYHHTAPVNALYGLHEALLLVLEEGLESRHARHAIMGEALCRGLAVLGLQRYVEAQFALPQLITVTVPRDLDEAQIRQALLRRYHIEIGGGLGELSGRVWRIGLMGETAQPSSVRALLGALGQSLEEPGGDKNTQRAIAAAEEVMGQIQKGSVTANS